MPKVQPPELKDFMDKRLSGEQPAPSESSVVNLHPMLHIPVVAAVALNANRLVTGVLRGFDQFMNIVLDNTVDEKSHTDIGMVVSWSTLLLLKIQCASHLAVNMITAVGDPREQHSDSGGTGALVAGVRRA